MPTKKQASAFNDVLIKHWEKSDGVNFAIALARITGWMLQVDWLAHKRHADVEEMVPVRVYVETNRDVVYDFTGRKSIMAFHKYVILPIAIKRTRTKNENIDTRCYSEEKLMELPLRVKASETEIDKATKAILANPAFLSLIPKRQNPEIPAYMASSFSHGRCVPFAEALMEIKGLPAVGISVSKFHDDCGTELGFCHAVVQHPDGCVEDSWGKQTLQDVLDRFYIREYQISEDFFVSHRSKQRLNSPVEYNEAYQNAISFLLT